VNQLRLLSFLAVCSASVTAATDFNGEVNGRVIDAVTGNGIARARVVVSVGASDRMVLLTDDEGTFRLLHLPAGGTSVWAQRPGYLGDPFDLSESESKAQLMISALPEGPATLTLRLTPASAIAGKATDAKDAGYARVRLWERDQNGKIVFHGEQNTDRTGEFRFAPLAAGRYYLEVSSLPANSSLDRHPVYLHRFYKEGSSLQTATPIDVALGRTESVSIPLESARGYRIRGRIACTDANSSSIHLRLEDDRIPLVLPAWDSPTRGFTFTNVPPGAYVLEATCNSLGGLSMPVTISDSDLDGVVLSPADR
jgi:carboxypeptidase family protein